MDTIVTINGKRVLCDEVLISGNKNNDSTPNANVGETTEVQTVSFENLQIDLNNVKFPITTEALADTTTFRYADLYDMYKHKYTGTNPYTLNVKIRGHEMLGLENSKDIKIILENFSLPLNATRSQDGYMISGSMTLLETK